MKKATLIIVIIIILIVVGVWYLNRASNQNSSEGDGTVPEEEVMGDDSMVGEVKEFDLVASNFKYDVTEIRVEKGDTVNINLRSEEGFHDWVVDEFDARTRQLQAGEFDSIQFVADKSGTFEFYCSVGNHRQMGMVGTLIVE